MKLKAPLSDGLNIFRSPRLLLAYACYTTLVAVMAEYIPPAQIITFIFLDPLLFSYIASRYFMGVVDPARQSDHRKLRFRFYVPFIGIFALFFLLTVITQVLNAGFIPVISISMLVFFALLSAAIDFWMAGTVFSCGSAWQGLRKAFGSMRGNFAVFGLIFFNYLVYGFCHEYYKVGQWDRQAPMPFIILHIVSAIIDLYALRVAIGLAAAARDHGDQRSFLDACISGKDDAAVQPASAVQMKRANICLLLGILSIIPVMHLFAVILGWKRFTRQQQGRFRAMVGFVLGAFFTALYCLALLGNIAANGKKAYVVPHISSLDAYMADSAVSDELKQILLQLKDANGSQSHALAQQLESMGSDQTQARYFALGLAHEYEAAPQQALAAFKKYQELGGSSPEAQFHIARINLFDTHDYFEARNSLTRFQMSHPHDTTAKLYISLIDNRVAWDGNWIISILSVIALLIAMTAHEFGHSVTAYKCGDTTAKEAGRMSLNPVVHLDLFGSIILPAFLILSRSAIIVGWAKPVPVNRENFRNPKRDNVLVALMGCFTNFSIALVSTIALALMTVILVIIAPQFATIHWLYPTDFISLAGVPFAKGWIYLEIFLTLMIVINIGIGVFNLIPIPPLDGSWLLERRLAPFLKGKFAAYQQFSFLIILILLFTNVIDMIIGSVLWVYFACVQLVLVPMMFLT
jgi:Zn-dependent protease